MDAEKIAAKIVGEARFHLRKKLENDAGLPLIEIPYSNSQFRRIKEIFSLLKEYAESQHMDVELAKDGSNHLRWAYKFQDAFAFSSDE